MSGLKNTLFTIITLVLMAVIVEGGLSALHYQMNDRKWAVERAFEAGADLWEKEVSKSLSKPLVMSADVLESLKQMGGVIENADNPTDIKRKDSPLTMADDVMVYKLRPSVKIWQHMATPTDPGNLDPPIVGYDATKPVPDNLQAWIKEHATLTYAYTTDASGNRITLPSVSSAEKIVVVGDSVAFGVGVDDGETLPSQLQTLVGSSRQVVNLGVGGYKAWQAYQAAVDSPDAGKGNTLIYIACQNDFNDTDPSGFDIAEMENWMRKFAALKDEGKYRDVIIVLQNYQEFGFHHFLNRWPDEQVKKIGEGFAYFDKISQGQGFTGINWYSMVKDYNARHHSMFAGLALYVDHVHLSPAGNRLLAEKLFSVLGPSTAAN